MIIVWPKESRTQSLKMHYKAEARNRKVQLEELELLRKCRAEGIVGNDKWLGEK